MPVIEPEAFVDALRDRGFDFYAGVPCSLIKGVLANLTEREDLPYVPAAREDGALGIAAGAFLGGKRPVVLMQNSGLGVSFNALFSLQKMYKLPCLLIITWRGWQGNDAPEHIEMGLVMPDLLDTAGIPHRTLDPDGTPGDILGTLDWADRTLNELGTPVAVLVRKGSVA